MRSSGRRGNRYTFRLRASTYMQTAMLVEEAAKLPAKRWATVAPNYEYGQSAVRWFKELLTRARPDVTFVAEQFPALGRIDAGATVQALAAAQARGDLQRHLRRRPDQFRPPGQHARAVRAARAWSRVLTGEPEYLDPLQDEAPEDWIVTGYPWDQINTPEHTAFRDAYRQRWNDYPRLGSVVGYDTVMAIAAMLRKTTARRDRGDGRCHGRAANSAPSSARWSSAPSTTNPPWAPSSAAPC